MKKLQISYSDAYLDWKLGGEDGSHPTDPIRAKLAVEILEQELPPLGVEFEVTAPKFDLSSGSEDIKKLLQVHSSAHVEEVLDRGTSGEWNGVSRSNARTAALMFGGTVGLVDKMLAEDGSAPRVAFNPQGAKHHAHRDYSSGFCVFNDMAWAALEFSAAGKKVVYIDWDVHAGDGVQAILEDSNVATFSIHGHGIFPNLKYTSTRGETGNYLLMNAEKNWYNYNLQLGSGDLGFEWAVDSVISKAMEYEPDVILLATGADGHASDHWGMNYTLGGYTMAANKVAELALKFDASVLIGGAGGYQPHTWTPRIWADVVKTIATAL